MIHEEDKLTPKEWARWALLGDPHIEPPQPFQELVKRVETAIEGALRNDTKRKTTIPS